MGKRSRSRNSGPSPSANQPVPPRRGVWATGVLVGGILVAVLLFPGRVKGFFDDSRGLPNSARQAFHDLRDWWDVDENASGIWTNEGNVTDDPRFEPPYAIFDLDVRKSGIDGTVQISTIADYMPMEFVLVEGNRAGDQLSLRVWDVINGKEVTLAMLKASLVETDGVPLLEIEPVQQAQPFFPKRLTLFKTGPTTIGTSWKAPEETK